MCRATPRGRPGNRHHQCLLLKCQARGFLWLRGPKTQKQLKVTYSSNKALLEPQQVAQLWDAAGVMQPNNARLIQTALQHSFSVEAAWVEAEASNSGQHALTPAASGKVLVGLARTISDGAFAALVTDITVHPAFREQGIGRNLIKRLVKDTLRQGPTSFAAFAPPHRRMFFWKCSFRWNGAFKVMKYTAFDNTLAEESAGQHVQQAGRSPTRSRLQRPDC
ncbi:hypothetical protein WJX72_008806 [[Myrmecia] bisecta]|uniref:N-acetyltransferase domain-containing protein n=1 Tax=[Myrmecia] bisecta TaxID=41462 RepID=A0AAW1P6Y7_9CHLO